MQRMSRALRLLTIYLLLELEKPTKVVRKYIRHSGGYWLAHNHPVSEITDAYTDADAIAAVEGEATLDLTGDVTSQGNIEVQQSSGDTLIGELASGYAEDAPAIRFVSTADGEKALIMFTSGYPFDFYVLDADDAMLANPLYYDRVADDFYFESNADFTGDVTVGGDFNVVGALTTDTVSERTAAAGVTIDGLLIKDSVIPDAGYPNALLLNGSRKMTGDIDLDDNSLLNVYSVKFQGTQDVALVAVSNALYIYNKALTAFRPFRAASFITQGTSACQIKNHLAVLKFEVAPYYDVIKMLVDDIRVPLLPTSDPADGNNRLWMDANRFVKVGT